MTGVVLRDGDIEALNGFLEVMAEPCPVAEFQRRTVESIPRVVPSEVTAWNEVDPSTTMMANPVIFPTPPDWQMSREAELRQAFAAHAHEHPVLQHQLRTGDGRPHTISDFYTQERFHQTQLYQTHYAFLGTEDQMAIKLPAPYLVVAITLTRGWQEFTERDRLLMNLMRPQIVQGLRNAQAYDRMSRLLASVEQRLEAVGEGLVLLDRHNAVEYASPNAIQILANWLGDWQGADLPDSLGEWITDGDGGRPARRPDAPPWPHILQRDRRQLTVQQVPTVEAGGIALLVTERALEVDVATVLARLGLTPRQAQVLELAIQGMTNARIAAQLHITTDTVESHMTLALARLGVGSRTAAANLIHQAVNDTDRPPTNVA